jgi:UMF1 family MFS transporter
VGALATGAFSDRIGHKKTISLTLLVWTGVAIWGGFIGFSGNPLAEVYGMGVVVGLVLGGSQSASRALQSTFTPEANAAEFFAFYGIAGKFASVIGPLVYGSVYALIGIRSAILSLCVFFVIGLVILHTVNEREGIQQARTAIT